MTTNETELIQLINDSSDPSLVAQFMLSLFSDYLRTRVPYQETRAAAPEESV